MPADTGDGPAGSGSPGRPHFFGALVAQVGDSNDPALLIGRQRQAARGGLRRLLSLLDLSALGGGLGGGLGGAGGLPFCFAGRGAGVGTLGVVR